MPKGPPRGIVLFALLLVLSPPRFASAAPHYEIEASYENGRISGRETITFQNNSKREVADLFLFLYPNIYKKRERGVDDGFYKKIYPKGFSEERPGETIIERIEVEGRPVQIVPVEGGALRGTLIRLPLPKPLPPGDSIEIVVSFSTRIPEKFGPMGRFKDAVYLQGGWHPYLPYFSRGRWDFRTVPERSDFDVTFTIPKGWRIAAPGGAREGGTRESGATESSTTYRLDHRGLFFPLGLIRQGVLTERESEGVPLSYLHLKGKTGYAQRVLNAAAAAVAFQAREHGLPQIERIAFSESYLFEELAVWGEGLILVSNRAFKVFPLLAKYHEAAIARAVFIALWQKRLPTEEEWVWEALAALDTGRFFAERHTGRDLKRLLRPFAFLPIVDQILYSRELPLRELYFGEIKRPSVYENMLTFNRPRLDGGGVMRKLSALAGPSAIERTVAAYLERLRRRDFRPFRRVAEEETGRDLTGFFGQWLSSNPLVDFGIEEVSSEPMPRGGFKTRVLVSRQGPGIEPVDIRLRQRSGRYDVVRWEGLSTRFEVITFTPSLVSVVEIDPDGVTNDIQRFNNRDPHLWKVLLDRFTLSYDFQTRVISYNAGFSFQRLYDDKNNVLFNVFSNEQSSGTALEYGHIFHYSHGVAFRLFFEKRALAEEGQTGLLGVVGARYRLSYPGVPFFAGYVQQLLGKYPSLSLTGDVNQQFTGGEYRRVALLSADLRRTWRISNFHEVAARVFAGHSVGDLFAGNRFYLGGENGVPGYEPLTFAGENLTLASLEYRFPLIYETDLNLGTLIIGHLLQGVIFADAGTVSNGHQTFDVGEYKRDVGGGFRWAVDFFGFYPSLARFDFAYPINSPIPRERKIHYYLSVGQRF